MSINSSGPEPLVFQDATLFTVLLLTVSIPILVLTVLGNLAVLLAWARCKELRNPQNVYFISLATVDLLTGLVVFPFDILYAYHQTWTYGLAMCAVWNISYFSLPPISAYHLVVIAFDRYRILTEGVHYIQRRSKMSIFLKIGGTWGIGALIVMPYILEWDYRNHDPSAQKTCLAKETPFWGTHIFLTSLLIPGILLARLYTLVYVQISKRLKKHVGGSIVMASAQADGNEFPSVSSNQSATLLHATSVVLPGKPTAQDEQDGVRPLPPRSTVADEIALFKAERRKAKIKKEKQTAVTLAMICATFLLCWAPWYSCFLFSSFVSPEWKPSATTLTWTATFGLANSCVNPLFYAARMPDFQRAFRKSFIFWR